MKGEGEIDAVDDILELARGIGPLHHDVADIEALGDDFGVERRGLARFPGDDDVARGDPLALAQVSMAEQKGTTSAV